jgi:hypothetical protein
MGFWRRWGAAMAVSGPEGRRGFVVQNCGNSDLDNHSTKKQKVRVDFSPPCNHSLGVTLLLRSPCRELDSCRLARSFLGRAAFHRSTVSYRQSTIAPRLAMGNSTEQVDGPCL